MKDMLRPIRVQRTENKILNEVEESLGRLTAHAQRVSKSVGIFTTLRVKSDRS